MDNLVYWIWLSLACTPGSNTFAKLLERYKSPKEVYDADEEAIAAVVTSRSSDYDSLVCKNLEQAENVLSFCRSKKVGILTYSDESFPESLREIPTPPVLLYYRGVLPNFKEIFPISIVGTRRLSDYGRRNAFNISFDLARAGATVVSGMALGIDSVAHAGALAAKKVTVAVLGSGIDVCYPSQHITLAKEIVKTGCIFTEYPPGSVPDGRHFPVRNRIISGLSRLTLVVEGRERSGALITARHAKEQGRPVYALPGNVGNGNSELSNLLIKNGAVLCTSADDIVRDFDVDSRGILNPFELAKKVKVNMNDVFNRLKISCVSQDDGGIFRSSRKRNATVPVREYVQDTVVESPENEAPPSLSGIDDRAIKLYKKIPVGVECEIDDLVDEEFSSNEVSRLLLKLEMCRVIKMLPGEKIRRNI